MHTLLQFLICPRSRSIRLLLAELGFEFSMRDEKPWQCGAEFLDLNPSGELPVLIRADGPVLSGVYAITEFIDEDMRALEGQVVQQTMFPGNQINRAEIRRLTDWFLHKMDDEVTGCFLAEKVYSGYIEGEGASPDTEAMRVARDNLHYHMSYISHLAVARSWLAGDQMSFADLIAASHLSTLDYLGEMPWDEYEDAKLWYARIKSRRSFRPLLTDRIPGLEPPAHYDDLDF